MARWEIKNVGMKGVAMTVPENVVKTSELGLLSQEEADVFDNTVGIKERQYRSGHNVRLGYVPGCCRETA